MSVTHMRPECRQRWARQNLAYKSHRSTASSLSFSGGRIAFSMPLISKNLEAAVRRCVRICENCGTPLPEGCGGLFKDDGAACALAASKGGA